MERVAVSVSQHDVEGESPTRQSGEPVRGTRNDSTHRPIFDRAKALGCTCVEIRATRYISTKGQPDGFVWNPLRDEWLAVQVKGPRTKITAEQLALARNARVWLVRTPEEIESLILTGHL